MKITILTMFPELFAGFLQGPIPRRAAERGIAQIELVDIKDYAGGCYRHIDDSTFGGGAGMVLRAQPVLDALSAVRGSDVTDVSVGGSIDSTGPAQEAAPKGAAKSAETAGCGERLSEDTAAAVETFPNHSGTLIAALTPVGPLYRQKIAARYAQLEHLILICGHYEGMDERIYAQADERISIGDYVLSGGEPAAMVVTDSVLRLLPGVLRAESTAEESFCGRGFLEYPQYTRPADINGVTVPDVLLSGNHEEIRRWRLVESIRATLRWRPDLLEHMDLTEEERGILQKLIGNGMIEDT